MMTRLLTALGFMLCFVVALRASRDDLIVTSAYSKAHASYKREKTAQGTFKREYYALSNGGALPGTIRDREIEKVEFPKVAGVLAQELGRQNYFLAPDKKSADLLIVVHWGTTIPFSNLNYSSAINDAGAALAAVSPNGMSQRSGGSFGVPAADPFTAAAEAEAEDAMMKMMMAGRLRDQANIGNARLLGYVEEINDVNDVARYAGGGHYYDDLIDDIEEPRYYIIVTAYDFREIVDKGNKKPLWVTRLSMRAHGSSFERHFARLLAAGSKHFGQTSDRLFRKTERTPNVEIGEAKVIGIAPAPKASEKK